MIEFVLGGSLIIALWAVYSCYVRPKNQIKRYSQRLKDLGYSVYQTPYHPFEVSLLKDYETSIKDHGDSLYTQKNKYTKVDVAFQYVFNKLVLVLMNPDLLKQFYAPDKVAIYPKSNMVIEAIKQLLGEGILFSEGAKWKHKRRLISNAFSFDLLKQNIPKICNICDRKFADLENGSNIKEGEFSYNLINLGNRIFNGVMMACFFGSDQVKEKVNDQNFDTFMVNLMNDANDISMSPLVVLLGKKAFAFGGITPKIRDILGRIRILKSIASNIIAKRTEEVSKGIKSSTCSDIVENLIKAEQKEKQKGIVQSELTNKDLVEEFCTFVIAGTDTTAHLFTMMVYYITQNPQIEQRLRKDINQVIKGDQDCNYENLKKLTYIDWIQLETTRHYGPFTGLFFRQAMEDNFIGKIPIPKGTVLTIQPVGNHYNEQYFKNPEQFRPERWESECNNLKPFTLTNFSGGPRTCIGKHLAILESKIALVKLFKRYEKILNPKQKLIMDYKFVYQPQPFKTTFVRNTENQQ